MARRQNEICMIVLDVGKSMHETITGGKPNIEHAKQAVKALIQQKLLFAANDEVSLIWFGTEGTDNPMNTRSGGYQHVTVKDQPEKSSVRLIEQLDEISEETPTQGDFTDALLVAMDIAIAHAGKRKALKRIFLLTDGAGEVPPENAAQAEDIIKGLSTNDIKLNVIGINFSEEEEAGDDERKHAGRTKAQVDNERLLRRIADEAEGAVIPISNALEMLAAFRARSVGQVAKMRADLEIGDVKLPVHTFAKTSTQNMPSLKKTTEDEHKVRMDRSYWNKASEDDEKQQVPDDHRSRAYFFGADKVTNVDNAALKFNNPDPGLVVLGFVKAESIPRHWFLSTVDTVVAEPGNQRAAVGLSGLIHALYEQKRVAICRYTKKANTHPLLVCLHPVVKADIECFYLNVLPFMEDFRQFTFATFTTDVSKQPSGAQMQAAERLINKLDLDLLHGDDEDDEPAEALKPKLTFNPALQRCYQTLEGRAVDPSAPVAEIPPVISSYLAPDRALFEKAAAEVAEFKRVFGLAKIEEDETKKKKGKKRHWRDYLAAPEDDAKEKAEPVDHDGTKEIKLADIDSANVEHIGSADPVSDFNAMLKEGERRKDEAGAELITNAIRELSEMIKSLIRNSMGDFNYPKAADCIEALRKGCIQHDEAAKYNACLNEVRNLFMERRPDFWKLLAERELYPIDRTECTSDIEPDAARKFFEIGAAASSSLGLPRMSAPDESADVFQDLD